MDSQNMQEGMGRKCRLQTRSYQMSQFSRQHRDTNHVSANQSFTGTPIIKQGCFSLKTAIQECTPLKKVAFLFSTLCDEGLHYQVRFSFTPTAHQPLLFFTVMIPS